MNEYTTDQLNVIVAALADHARRNREMAAEFDGKNMTGVPDDLQSMPDDLRRKERIAERLRARFAGELHRRGATSCELAHPGADCPNKDR